MAKRMETSKKLVYISDVVAVCLCCAVIYGTFFTEKDMSTLANVAMAAVAECGVANGLYYWKAKNENRYKYVMRLVKDWADKYGIDSVANLAEIVLKD